VGVVEDVSRFAELLATPNPRLDLALALIAATGRPDVDPDELLRALDELSLQVSSSGAEEIFRELFSPDGPIGLRGDRSDYYDPDNSLLDRVLRRRQGIPITLSVIGIEVARRHGMELVGIGMPGHFLVGDRTTGRFIDAFDGGRSFGPDGARVLFHSLHGPDTVFESTYLEPTSATMIVIRVLNNLRGAHLRRGDRAGVARALQLQAALPGSSVAARRDLAGVLAADGRFLEAAEVHESLAVDDEAESHDHELAALRLRARLN
jgi:regulator of sirC expression with transglutaminase-like and TPR domain